MRNVSVLSLVAALGLAACADQQRPFELVPPPPEFESSAPPDPTETPVSTERQEPITPEDQVLFALDSATLEPGAGAVLDDAARWVQADPTRTILIRGHADPSGAEEHNLELSARRAEAVAGYLQHQGVARNQISITAVGEQAAVVEPADGNRRVVLFGMRRDDDETASR